ncbi:MAG: DUF4160 domain-containing protein [Ruminococcus sp.]
MRSISFTIYICGINEETYTEKIMIYKPHLSKDFYLTEKELLENEILSVSDFIIYIKKHYGTVIRSFIGDYSYSKMNFDTVYFNHKDYMLGFLENKNLTEVFDYTKSETISFVFFVVGGASFNIDKKYKIIIHANEDNHKYMPHVHVEKDNISVRYSLETLEPIDKLVYPHKRDNKKVIEPFLRENSDFLMNLWNDYQNKYRVPTMTNDGRQYYSES